MLVHYRRAVLDAVRHGFKLGRPFQNPEALLRVAVAVVAATVVGYLTNEPMPAIGAWFSGMGSLVPRRRNRVAISAASTLMLCIAGPLLGVWLHPTPWLLYVLAFAGTFLGGLLLTIGVGPGMRVVIMMIMMVAFADISPDVTTGLSEVKWLAVGGAIGFLCHLLPPYGPRFAAQREAVAALYDALAADARAYARGQTPDQPWPLPLLTARQTLDAVPQRSRAAAAPLFALLGEAHRLVPHLRALESTVDGDPAVREARHTAAADILSGIATAVRSGKPVTGAPEHLPEPRPGEPLEATLRALGDLLDEARRVASLPVSRDAGASWQHAELTGPHALSGFFTRGLGQLRAEFRTDSPALRHALRLAFAATLAEAVGRATGDWGGLGVSSHAVWAFLTAAVVLVPTFGHTIGRAVSRSSGAVVGGLLGWALVMLPDDRLLHAVLVVVLIFGYLVLRSVGQAPVIICITAVVAYIGGSGASAWSRTVDTLIGAAIAVAVQFLWPTWHTDRLPRLLGEWSRSEARHLDAVVRVWADPAGADRDALAGLRHEARLARRRYQEAATEAASEPVHHRARWSGSRLAALSRATRELTKGTALLAAHLPEPDRAPVPEAADHAEILHERLTRLAARAETGAAAEAVPEVQPLELLALDPAAEPDRELFARVADAMAELERAVEDRRPEHGRHRLDPAAGAA
ncbi:FUSC family protein [Streptomyces bauhiniae]|uniref:FUSC family protein n=1 Tax=Streptomyces bauhiniae TaxID=2340725 RepID=UPI00368820DA